MVSETPGTGAGPGISAESEECDHARGRTWAWYGDEVLFCFDDAGELVEHRTFSQMSLTWSMEREQMRVEVKAALLSLVPEPGYFARRQREILGEHWVETSCDLENV